MAISMKNVHVEFHGVGHKAGTDIWRMENFQPVPVPRSSHGKFYSGDSYIILRTVILKSGAYHYDIHFWLGKDTSQDEAGVAAFKSVELDVALGGRTVQYRETQGHETERFLSLFKPCIIPLEGGVASGFLKLEVKKYEPRLFACKGGRVVRVKQVPFVRASLNHDNVFVLDMESKIYQFNGATSSIQERGKALEVVQFIKDTDHEGKCEVIVVDDGMLGSEANTGKFWSLFGGFAPLAKKAAAETAALEGAVAGKLLWSVVDGKAKEVDNCGELRREMLDSSKCFLIDCGPELFVWTGRNTAIVQRKAAVLAAEDYVATSRVSSQTLLTILIEGFETGAFQSIFSGWSLNADPALSEEGKCKVAALLSQQGVNVEGLLKGAPAKKEVPHLLSPGGKLQVWHVKGDAKTPLLAAEVGKFYDSNCYITLYSYQVEHKEEHFLCHWIGQRSSEKDKVAAARLSNDLFLSLKSRPVEARIVQGSEPAQFLALFDGMIIFRGLPPESENGRSILLQIGANPYNTPAVEVEQVAASLNSSRCFVLHIGSRWFTWYGNLSTGEEQKAAIRVAESLKGGSPVKPLKEGSEPPEFWSALGGKESYPSHQEVQDGSKDPQLFVCRTTKETMKVSEVFNFTQEDLLTEDVMILDSRSAIYVWVGRHSSTYDKQRALDFGQEYVVQAVASDGLSPDCPVIKVPEGHESASFRVFFAWDQKKAGAYGNTYERKLAEFQFLPDRYAQNTKKLTTSEDGASPQRATAIAALSSAFASLTPKFGRGLVPGTSCSPRTPESPKDDGYVHIQTGSSQKGTAMKALSSVFDSVKEPSSLGGDWVSLSSPTMKVEALNDSDCSSDTLVENSVEAAAPPVAYGVLSYESLKTKSANPAPGIDATKREIYLSPADFRSLFGMNRVQFYALPKWKQDQCKRGLDLF